MFDGTKYKTSILISVLGNHYSEMLCTLGTSTLRKSKNLDIASILKRTSVIHSEHGLYRTYRSFLELKTIIGIAIAPISNHNYYIVVIIYINHVRYSLFSSIQKRPHRHCSSRDEQISNTRSRRSSWSGRSCVGRLRCSE